MGYQLWTSKLTGYRRKGTKFTSLKQIFIDNVTAKSIFEPLLSCPINSSGIDAKNALTARDFDVAGIKCEEGDDVKGYVLTEEIGDDSLDKYIKRFDQKDLISDSTPIAEIFDALSHKNHVFVLFGNKVIGIITTADINKPPVRIYIFGIISLLEMHLNSWINHYYPHETWIENIQGNRIDEARKIYEKRKGNNQVLSLLECLQLCDKRELLKNNGDFRNLFGFSKNKFDTFIKRSEKIRNELAHSQNSIISNMNWEKFVGTISLTEQFLVVSDTEVERIANEGIEFQDLLI